MGLQRLSWHVAAILCGSAVAATGLIGCDSGPKEKLTPVVGKVTIAGAPLRSGSVSFHPDAAKGNNTKHIPTGALDEQGAFKLMSADKEGAPLGWYTVTVTSQAPIDPANPYAMPKHLIDAKFSDAKTSGLAIQVVENAAPDAYTFDLKK